MASAKPRIRPRSPAKWSRHSLRSGRAASGRSALRSRGVVEGGAKPGCWSSICRRSRRSRRAGLPSGSPSAGSISWMRRSAAARLARADGTLTIMVGASPQAFARAEPVLARDGHAAPSRAGRHGRDGQARQSDHHRERHDRQRRGLGLRKARGRRTRRGAAVLASATASNYLLEKWLPKTWLAGTFEGGFALDLLRKDLAAALDAARADELSDAGNGAGLSTLHQLAPQKGTARWITAR